MNKSTSMFVGGILVGTFVATAGFSLYLKGKKATGGILASFGYIKGENDV